MPWIMQMVGFAVLLLGLAFAVWVSLWLLLALFAIGLIAVVWAHLKTYLIAKGILNPTPGVPPVTEDAPPTITVIDGDYKRVDSE
ncbi:MAG: hypothetical protein ACKVOE_01875 [Rickettsiales bacterium]